MRTAFHCTLALALAFACSSTRAENYPDRAVRVIVPYPAGGTSDQIARLLFVRLSAILGQTFYIENKPGGIGTIGALDVMRAPPDGYTLMLTENTFTITPSLFKVRKFDPAADFTPIALVAGTPVALVVANASPYKTVADLVEASKKSPRGMEYGAGGYGGATHLAFELFAEQSRGNFVNIPYKGSGEVMGALLGGTVQALISGTPSVAGQIKGGSIRALAVSGEQRQAAFPTVPTFIEAGFPNYKVRPWFGLLGPKGMPVDKVTKLYDAVARALATPQLRVAMDGIGAAPQSISPSEFGQKLRDEVRSWSAVAKSAHIEPQ